MLLVVKNLSVNAGDISDVGSVPELGRSPGEGMAAPPIFLPREPHGQRSLWLQSMASQRVGHD